MISIAMRVSMPSIRVAIGLISKCTQNTASAFVLALLTTTLDFFASTLNTTNRAKACRKRKIDCQTFGFGVSDDHMVDTDPQEDVLMIPYPGLLPCVFLKCYFFSLDGAPRNPHRLPMQLNEVEEFIVATNWIRVFLIACQSAVC